MGKDNPRRSRWARPPTPEDNSALSVLAKSLFEIEFKSLKRPTYTPGQGRSAKELRWAVRVFTCSSAGLFRDMLRSYLIVRDQKLEAASFLVMRLMFEIVAMANYLHQAIKPLLEQSKFGQAWEIIDRANIGSYYMIQQGHKRPQGSEPAIPLKVGKAVSSLNAMLPERDPGWAEIEYSFLSEFSHPDAFALMHYSEMNPQSDTVHFHADPEADVGYLRHIAGSIVALFGVIYLRLFDLAEMHTAKKLIKGMIGTFLAAEGTDINRN